MGRAARYTLSVMVWVSTFALWTGVVGLAIAAATGERLTDGDAVTDAVHPAVSAAFLVLMPLVPTLVSLWFNDWARDGFPSRDERRASGVVAEATDTPAAAEAPAPEEPVRDLREPDEPAAPHDVPADVMAPLSAHTVPSGRAGRPSPPVIRPMPLGVPAAPESAHAAPASGYPVAPLLRDVPPSPAPAPAPVDESDNGRPDAPDLAELTIPPIDPLTAPLTELQATAPAGEVRLGLRPITDADVAGSVEIDASIEN